MRVDWDENKAGTNLRKHGVSFGEARSVFFDPLAKTVFDPDHSEMENRWVTIGFSKEGRLLVVCHAERGNTIRIISARRTTKTESKSHEKEIGRRH